MSSFLQGIVILHPGTQAFKHMMETDFGISEDHEIYDYIKLITHPDELTSEDYPKMWDVYYGLFGSANFSPHWRTERLDPMYQTMGPAFGNPQIFITKLLVHLLNKYQGDIKNIRLNGCGCNPAGAAEYYD